jgi:signal transduction histidine kinase
VKTFASIGVVLGAVAGILGVSVASALSEQKHLMEGFTATTRQQVRTSVEALSARLDALDQDTRMLVDLVESSRGRAELENERRVWDGAFRAMASVVAQYRTISLFGPDGTLQVMAVHPTETADTVEALRNPTRRLAAEVEAKSSKALGSPARHDARSFLLYGAPVRGGGAIVVASDAAIFLSAVAWTPLPVARLFVTDPAGVIWGNCEMAGGCRATSVEAIPKALEGTIVKPAPPGRQGARGASVPGGPPAVEVSERVSRPTGSWQVTWMASTEELMSRQRSLLERVIATGLAASLAVAAAAAFIMRQQKKAVTLESRLEVAQALASARETSQSIVENAPLGVLGVSSDMRVVLANGFLTERLGPIVLGAPLREAFSGAGQAWRDELEPLLLAAVRGDATSEPQELRAMGSDAHQLYVRVVPVRNHALGVRVFAIVEDQSALRNLENQLVRAEKLITVGVLSAGIAHEIGSPLAVIRGRAEQVLKHLKDPPEAGPRADDVRVIIKHIDNITSTIRQLLDFSRRQAVAPSAVPLALAVERARGLVQWKLAAKELELKVTLDGALPPLAADPDQLQQVLVNLLLNACDASEKGRAVTVTARGSAGKEVTFEVVDRGCGIAAEHMNAVFDPFFTTKQRGEGTGLGLTIAAGIVRNHGGRINLTSAPGRGTTVTVRWPVASERKGEVATLA